MGVGGVVVGVASVGGFVLVVAMFVVSVVGGVLVPLSLFSSEQTRK